MNRKEVDLESLLYIVVSPGGYVPRLNSQESQLMQGSFSFWYRRVLAGLSDIFGNGSTVLTMTRRK